MKNKKKQADKAMKEIRAFIVAETATLNTELISEIDQIRQRAMAGFDKIQEDHGTKSAE